MVSGEARGPGSFQRRRDDNKNKICGFEGGGALRAERKIVQNAVFRGKRHDNKIFNESGNFIIEIICCHCAGSYRRHWGDTACGIPTPKMRPPTVRESHKPGPPLEPGPPDSCPFPKRCRGVLNAPRSQRYSCECECEF